MCDAVEIAPEHFLDPARRRIPRSSHRSCARRHAHAANRSSRIHRGGRSTHAPGAAAVTATSKPKAASKSLAPMPGKVVRLLVEPGDKVQAGQGLLVVEAMKMQNEVRSPKTGTVERLLAKKANPSTPAKSCRLDRRLRERANARGHHSLPWSGYCYLSEGNLGRIEAIVRIAQSSREL